MTMKEFAELDEKKRGEALALLGLFFSAPEEKPEEKPEPSKAPMRTIPQAIDELKKEDPGTALTEYTLKRLVSSGEIPHVCAKGGRRLVNMDILKRYLNGTYPAQRGAERDFKR